LWGPSAWAAESRYQCNTDYAAAIPKLGSAGGYYVLGPGKFGAAMQKFTITVKTSLSKGDADCFSADTLTFLKQPPPQSAEIHTSSQTWEESANELLPKPCSDASQCPSEHGLYPFLGVGNYVSFCLSNFYAHVSFLGGEFSSFDGGFYVDFGTQNVLQFYGESFEIYAKSYSYIARGRCQLAK
jgi:hypothetical protein